MKTRKVIRFFESTGVLLFLTIFFHSAPACGQNVAESRLADQETANENARQANRPSKAGDRLSVLGRASAPVSLSATDADDDGMPDDWETQYSLNPSDPSDAWGDPDGDKVVNLFEYQLNSHPRGNATPPIRTVAPSGADYASLSTALNAAAPGTCLRVAAQTWNINYMTFNIKKIMIQGGWNANFSRRDLALQATILDGANLDTILYFSQTGSTPSGEEVVILDGLRFMHGSGSTGAVRLLTKGTVVSKFSLVNCIFQNNTSTGDGVTPYGGAFSSFVWNSGSSDLTLANVLIARNASSGIYAQHSETATCRWRIIHCTIAGNTQSGDNGYGIDTFTLDTARLDARITNSIVWGNQRFDLNPRDNITVSVDYSDIGTIPTDLRGAQYLPGQGVINLDPRFANPIGGDYGLTPPSPCMDAGSMGGIIAFDLLGKPRPVDGDGNGSVVGDIGAYEYQVPAKNGMEDWLLYR